MPTPRRESAQGPTSAQSYVLECKLLRAYHQLYEQAVAPARCPASLRAIQVDLLGGQLASTQVRHAESRLCEVMPEVIRKLRPEQQPLVAELLLGEAADLRAVIKELVRLERNLNYREDEANLHLNDDGRLKAAGLGRLTRENYIKPHDPANPSQRWLRRSKQPTPTVGQL
jgi:hypothetical protein